MDKGQLVKDFVMEQVFIDNRYLTLLKDPRFMNKSNYSSCMVKVKAEYHRIANENIENLNSYLSYLEAS